MKYILIEIMFYLFLIGVLALIVTYGVDTKKHLQFQCKRKLLFLKGKIKSLMNKGKFDVLSDDEFSEIVRDSKITQEELTKILDNGKTLEQTIRESYQNAKNRYNKSKNPKFHRSEKEQNISFRFYETHKSKIDFMEKEIYNAEKFAHRFINKYERNQILFEELEKECNLLFKSYEDMKRYCYSVGRGGKIYFQDMWEYCHNDYNDCFEFIKPTQEYLEQNKR